MSASIKRIVEFDIRLCTLSDLRKLEWFGAFTAHREILEATFHLQSRGEAVMLIAALHAFPSGRSG